MSALRRFAVVLAPFAAVAALASLAAASFPLPGSRGETHLEAYNAANLAATVKIAQFVVANSSTLADASFVVDVTGVGGGNFVTTLCSDGATCSGANLKATCTTACAAAAGTVTSCTVNNAAIAAGSTLTLAVSTACATTDTAGNYENHLTSP
jgi:hypothetical protein